MCVCVCVHSRVVASWKHTFLSWCFGYHASLALCDKVNDILAQAICLSLGTPRPSFVQAVLLQGVRGNVIVEGASFRYREDCTCG